MRSRDARVLVVERLTADGWIALPFRLEEVVDAVDRLRERAS
jgi:predicted ATP-dependent serine protease